jgi:nicotinate-nucleotide adenylyltransferase
VLELEGRREGPSYTVDTLDALRRLQPAGTRFRLVLGADAFQDFPMWHDWEGILDRADLLVAARPGHDVEPPPEFEGRNAPVEVLETPALDVSSTDLRRRLGAGKPVGEDVSPAVAAYVRDHGLYREEAAAAPSAPSEGARGAAAGESPGA